MNSSILLHKLLVLLALSIAANLDNLGVGIAYGMGRRPIPPLENFLIALLSGGLTFVAMMFGQIVQRILPETVANDLGAIVIIGVGIWVYWELALQPISSLVQSWLGQHFWTPLIKLISKRRKLNQRQTIPPRNMPYKTVGKKHPQAFNLKETLILGISLALNAMAGGFGASLAGHNAVITSVAIGVFSYWAIDIGQKLSRTYFSKWLGPLSQKAAGILLIGIGVYELLF